MTSATFDSTSDQGRVSITLRGEIDLDNAPELEGKIRQAVLDGTTEVTLDLSGLTYVDSIGMRALFLLASNLDARGIPLTIVAAAGSMARRVIELTGLGSLASLQPD